MSSTIKAFVFCTIVIFSSLGHALDPILISYPKTRKDSALLTKKILIEKFYIPESLIGLERTFWPCPDRPTFALHLCFPKEGDFQVRNIKKEVIQTSFSVFMDGSSL
jgi:hypothetical protein